MLTTGIPAEIGHVAGGAYSMVLKSGTNQLHFASEECYINKGCVANYRMSTLCFIPRAQLMGVSGQ